MRVAVLQGGELVVLSRQRSSAVIGEYCKTTGCTQELQAEAWRKRSLNELR